MRPGRFLVVPLLAILALLVVQAWGAVLEPTPVITDTSDDLRRIVWRGAVQPDGVVAVELRLEFRDDEERDLGFDLPADAQQVRVDGVPVAVSDFSNGPVGVFQGTASISYEVAGAVRRFEDGALVELGMYPSLISYTGLGDTEVQGVLSWYDDSGSWDHRFIVPPLHDIRAERIIASGADGAAVRFTAAGFPWRDATMLAELTSSAVPSAPVVAGTVDDAFDARRAELTEGPLEDGEPDDYTPVRQLVAAVLLSAWLGLLLTWLVPRWRRAAAEQAGAAAGVPDEIHEPPSALPPAVVGMLVGTSGGGERSVVAGTLLGLAARREIRIDGIDSERFTLRIPASTSGVDEFERLLLTALRPQGQAAAEVMLTGPPLWSDGPHPFVRPMRRAMHKRARGDGLTTPAFSPVVLLVAAVVMGVTALVGSGGRSTVAVVALIAGPVLAIGAGLAAGFALTRRGRRARAEWVAYGRFLRESGSLADLGVPAIAVWGPHLAYGAVLGVCPTAARALSPRFDRKPV